MSLVHKTKKEEGKKHKTKKKTQKKQQIFKTKLGKDRFRMFGPHSKPISACFGRRLIQPDSGRIGSVRQESARIKVESARI